MTKKEEAKFPCLQRYSAAPISIAEVGRLNGTWKWILRIGMSAFSPQK